MNKVESISIHGFWGNHSLKIPFHDDVNFLIGVNGSGKTTVINLIAAVLTADFETLDRYDFQKIVVKLKSGRLRPRVEVTKTNAPRQSFPAIEYQIHDTAGATAAVYSLSDLEEQFAIRGIRHMPRSIYQQRIHQLTHSRGLLEHLQSLVNVRWLSVNRANLSRTVKEEKGTESTVDQKLIELTQQFAIYFGSLSGAAEKETEKYQKTFFVSLIPTSTDLQTLFDDRSLDLPNEKKALKEIYQRFKVDAAEYQSRLDEYFQETARSFVEAKKNPDVYQVQDIVNILGIWRIHDLVQKWEQLNTVLQDIYAPRRNFLEVLNSLLQRKNLFLNEKNELWVKTESGKTFPVTYLSSGEKQLIIILGEALLQLDEEWVYIADEPELSLHVRWQEQLIASIRKVNSKAQIIVATHSPDIVSVFNEKVFDMELILK